MNTTVKYAGRFATVTTERGTCMIIVDKSMRPNATARGGAYYDCWAAKSRGMKVTADTRKEAVALMVERLRSNGFAI